MPTYELETEDGTFEIDSPDELTPEEIQTFIQPRTKGIAEQVLGGGLNVLDTALLGAGDEIVSGAQAPIRAVMEGIPVSEAYDQNLATTRQAMAGFRDENPWSAAGLNLIGGVVSPASRLGFGGGSIAKNIGSGAVQGGLYGFNSGEGDPESRAIAGGKAMGTGGAVGAMTGAAGAALRSVAKAAPEARLSRVAQALGISKSDWKKAADKGRGFSQGKDDEILTILDRAVRYVDENFDVGNLSKEELQSALALAKKQEGSKIGAILKEVDDTLAQKKETVYPDLADLREEFSSGKTNLLKSKEVLARLKKAVRTYREGLDGTVSGIENQKRELQDYIYEKQRDNTYNDSVDRKISTSLKKATEAIIRAEKGEGKEAAFKAAKEAFANLQIVEQLAGFANYMGKKGAADEEFFKIFKTSGGKLTSPAILGANMGEALGQTMGSPSVGKAAGILAGLGIGGASYGANTDTGRRFIIRGLKALPTFVEKGGRVKNQMMTPATVSALGLTEMLPNQIENQERDRASLRSPYEELISRLTGE